jgi:hypothetical protein
VSAAQAKDQKAVIVYVVFGILLLVFVIYGYNAFFGGTSAPPAARTTPVATETVPARATEQRSVNGVRGANAGLRIAPGVAATKMASTSSSLDPTLHESAMLRTESLVYSGSGRNIFSATYVPPVNIPKNMPKARPGMSAGTAPVLQQGPPPPPPINLKFFGTAIRAGGLRQAFLLNGEDVYLASAGDIVARKYKIISIGTNNIQVEDLQNDNTQSLPLQMN